MIATTATAAINFVFMPVSICKSRLERGYAQGPCRLLRSVAAELKSDHESVGAPGLVMGYWLALRLAMRDDANSARFRHKGVQCCAVAIVERSTNDRLIDKHKIAMTNRFAAYRAVIEPS
jgi:hypothetical protein